MTETSPTQPENAWRSFYCADDNHKACKREFGSIYSPGKERRPLAVCKCPCHERTTP